MYIHVHIYIYIHMYTYKGERTCVHAYMWRCARVDVNKYIFVSKCLRSPVHLSERFKSRQCILLPSRLHSCSLPTRSLPARLHSLSPPAPFLPCLFPPTMTLHSWVPLNIHIDTNIRCGCIDENIHACIHQSADVCIHTVIHLRMQIQVRSAKARF